MNATPVDRPSSPSIQLMLLIIPTIQKIVSPAAIGPTDEKRIGAPPSGLAMKSMVIPSATAKQASAIWPSSWTRARRSNRSSMAPSAGRDRPTEQQRRHLRWGEGGWDRHEVRTLVDEEEEAGDQQERGADRKAPAARDGDRVDAPGLRSVDHPVAQDDGADQRA